MVKLSLFIGAVINGGLLGGLAAIGLESPVPAGPIGIGAVVGAVYAAFRLGKGEFTDKVPLVCFFVGAIAIGGGAGFLVGLGILTSGNPLPALAGALVGALYAAYAIGSGSLKRASEPRPAVPTTTGERPPLGFFGLLNRLLVCVAIGTAVPFIASSAFPQKWSEVRSWAVANNISGATTVFDREVQYSIAATAAVFFIPAFLGCWWLMALWRRFITR